METISLKEVLEFLDSGQTAASISFVTYDKKRNRGGELITLENVTSTYLKKPKRIPSTLTAPPVPDSTATKRPNHWRNRTRNLRRPGFAQPMKVHILLITRFNGKIVHY